MRTLKIQFSNNGRSINVVIKCTEGALSDYREGNISASELVYDRLSDGQRKKIEDVFGAMNAYHSTIEIL